MSVPSTRYKTRLFLEKNAKILKNFSTCNRYNCNTFSDRDTKILFQYLKLLFSGQCPMQKKISCRINSEYKTVFKKMCNIFQQNSNSFECNLTFQELLKAFHTIIPIFIENISLKSYNLKNLYKNE